MRYFSVLCFMFYSIIIAPSIYAQTETRNQETVYLDLEKAIEMALEFNHDIRIADYNRKIADEQITEAWGSAVYPQLDGTGLYRKALRRAVMILNLPFPGIPDKVPMGSIHQMSFGATLEQTIFSGAAFIAIRAAEIYGDLMEKAYEASEDELIVQIKSAYYLVLLSKEMVDLSEVSLKFAEDNLKNTMSLYEAGLVPEYDFVRARVQVQNLKPQLQEAKNSYEVAKNTLRLVTGIEYEKDVVLTDSLVYREIPRHDLSALIEIFMLENPQLKQLELQTELQGANVSLQQAGYWPSVSASLTWDLDAQEDEREFTRWRYANSVYLNVSLRVPIFNGFQTAARVEQAELEKKIAEETYSKTKRALRNQVQETVLHILTQKDKIQAYELTIKEAQLAYDIAQKRFKNGLGTQLEIVDALVGLTSAKVNYYNAIFNYYLDNAELDRLLGTEQGENYQ